MAVIKFPFWLVALIALVLSACAASPASPPLARYEFERPEMGVPFRIVLYAPDHSTATNAAEAAFQRIQQLNDIMSDYDPESELSKLSHTSGQGKQVHVSDELWFVLERAQSLALKSGGAFDVTVGPYVNLWRRARRQHQLPDSAHLDRARQSVGYQHVRLDPKQHTVELLAPDMRLDLGGIAKGYALDEALKVLQTNGIHSALIEGGGDVLVGEPPPDKEAWRIQLSSVDATNAPPARFLLLKNRAISTSGDLYQRLEIDGKRYSHIVDPHTGIGLTNHAVVNVIAPNGITSDSLTKVVSVLGPKAGFQIIESTPDTVSRSMSEIGGKIEVSTSLSFDDYLEK